MKNMVWKKLVVSALACTMLFTSIPVSALAQAQTSETDTQEEFQIAFANTYAKVGDPLTLEIAGAANCTYQWTNDAGEILSTESSYTPTEADLETMITVTVTSGEQSLAASMYCSNLPVVYIETENGAEIVSKVDYINATMKIQGNDTYQDSGILYDGAIEIRGRGNSTWGMPKKPYKIKLDKKKNLFDMGKNKHWVLLANYSDETLMRNTLSYNLSGEMGMPQMETTWVDVILNGKYVGNYQFCEQIKVDDGNRVDIFDWESFAEDTAEVIATAESFSDDDAGDLEDYMKETDMSWITSGKVVFNDTTYLLSDYDIEIPSITGGYLMELDEYYDELSKFKTDSEQPIMFKNPEFVYTNSDMMKYVQTYIQSFENAVQSDDYTAQYEDTTKHYSELFDFDSLVNYWLINEIFFNEEINKKSTYMYKDIDSLVKMGPIWDMDYSSGGEGQTYHTEQWATVYYNTNAQANMWYKSLINDPYFILKAQERYWEIRNTSVQNMVDSIDEHYELLAESAAANAELWYGKQNFDSYVESLKTWFENHLSWLDQQMASEDSILSSLNYASGELKLTLTDETGISLPEDDLSANAPADALVEEGKAILLNFSSDSITGKADVYVNSRKAASATIGSNITITSEQLSAEAGEKDIIEVKVTDTDGKVLTQNCITVLEKESPRVTLLEEYVTLDADRFTYDGTAKIPQITVTYGETTLTENTDYTVEIINNINVGTATVTIEGIGRYQGTVVKTFTITLAEQENPPQDTNKDPSQDITQNPSQDTNGDSSQDTTQDVTVAAPKKVTGLKQTAAAKKSITLSWKKDSEASGYEVYRYNASKKKYVKVKDITTASVIRFRQKGLKAGTTYKYRVRAYKLINGTKLCGADSNAVSMATAPDTAKIKRLTTTKKAIKVQWTSKKCSGYEIQYSTNSKFKRNVEKVTVKKQKTTVKTIKGLKSNEKYYVRVRAYITLKGKTYYGAWNTKSIKVK